MKDLGLEAESKFYLAPEALLATGESGEESLGADTSAKKETEQESETREPGKDESEEQCELPSEKRAEYITNYIGPRQKPLDWTWRNTPQDEKSAMDAFSGSAVIAYKFKSKGLRAVPNDRLELLPPRRAGLIDNGKERPNAENVDKLLAGNGRAGSFVRDQFKGLFYPSGVHGLIDQTRAKCDRFSGDKKDIAAGVQSLSR